MVTGGGEGVYSLIVHLAGLVTMSCIEKRILRTVIC